ncbi:MAG: IS200/IS605 family transposase [Thermodesulfobacteriota bacterium]|nr:IS200/IS605 family transposase [Thermodesulfobacteriota bacterium]
MSEYVHKSHNVTVLIYHLVFPAKYRRAVFYNHVDEVVKEVCLDIEKRYQLKFLEIGTDKDHVHFLVQSIPRYSVTKIVTIIKSLTAREVFRRCPEVKNQLWGGEFWTDGYFASTVGKHGNEDTISKYVKSQRTQYDKLHEDYQLLPF